MKRTIVVAAVGLTIFSAGAVFSAQDAIRSLPNAGTIQISGTVDEIKNSREFVLRDNTGTIEIKLTPNASVVLRRGDNVTVTGAIERPLWGLMGKDISATDVQVHKDLPTALSDTVTKATGLSLDEAKSAQISQLPDQGLVKLNGTVDQVSGAKNFTLKDNTGTIDVSMKSDENAVLAKGTAVTVIGYVNNGFMGKKLDATRVIVTAEASTGAKTSNIQ